MKLLYALTIVAVLVFLYVWLGGPAYVRSMMGESYIVFARDNYKSAPSVWDTGSGQMSTPGGYDATIMGYDSKKFGEPLPVSRVAGVPLYK